jgi:hypothetical protein
MDLLPFETTTVISFIRFGIHGVPSGRIWTQLYEILNYNQEARQIEMQVKYSVKQTNLRPILVGLAPSAVLYQS